MGTAFTERLAPVRIGLLFSLLTLLYGFGMGAAFGAAEDSLKDGLKQDAAAVLADKYGGDEANAKKVTDKAWVYMKRAHLHANGLGTAGIALVLLLSTLGGSARLKSVTAAAFGIGSLGYGLYWMWAGLRAPGMGSTGAAKESLEWLAVPSSGACIAALVVVLVLFAKTAFSRSPAP